MLVGTFYTGTIEEFNGQCIKTKFFILGIPLFPVSSFYFVTKNQGISLPLVGRSARIGLGRTLCLVIGLVLSLLTLMYDDFPSTMLRILSMLGAVLFMGIAIYSWTLAQGATESDKRTRLILERTIGYNMLPSKLPKETRVLIAKKILASLNATYADFSMEQYLYRGDFAPSELPLLFCFAMYMESIGNHKPSSAFLARYPAESIQVK